MELLVTGNNLMRLSPATEAEVAQIVLEARAAKAPLVVEGGGTRNGLGRPVQAATTLSMAKLSGITLYEPSEMVIGAWAGTPLSVVQRTLDDRGQMLAFEPMDHRKLYGTTGEPTIGAVAACNISGPRRVMAGACRDGLIGVRFVNGKGEIIKNGGRVMKNVTGLDLVKLQAGAHGTLGVLTEVIFKVQPKPADEVSVCIDWLSPEQAVKAMAIAMSSPYEVTGAVHIVGSTNQTRDQTHIRLEGFSNQTEYRSAKLIEKLKEGGFEAELNFGGEFWSTIGNCSLGYESYYECIWRVSVPPSRGALLASEFENVFLLDWAGGLVWIGSIKADAKLSTKIHAAAARHGGHAMLVKAPADFRAVNPVFQPQTPILQKLQAGIKASFDPDGIINPGRMVAGV
ncbi:MAG: FAD-binding protein [Beijerinckiaceae bacterium]